MNKIKTLKVELLKALNDKPHKEITDSEANIIYYLSQDPDIQEVLSSRSKIDIICNPEKHGYKPCDSCEGYGGDNRRPDGVPHELCEDCGGDGVLPAGSGEPTLEELEEEQKMIYDESGFSSGVGVK
jgi:hypothetical protein